MWEVENASKNRHVVTCCELFPFVNLANIMDTLKQDVAYACLHASPACVGLPIIPLVNENKVLIGVEDTEIFFYFIVAVYCDLQKLK